MRDVDDRARRLEDAIRLKKAAARARPPEIEPRPSDRSARIGEMQRSLWLLHQMEPTSPAYNLASLYRVEGELDLPRLEEAFGRVVARHRLLRSTFHARGDQVLQIEHPPPRLAVEVVETTAGAGPAACRASAR